MVALKNASEHDTYIASAICFAVASKREIVSNLFLIYFRKAQKLLPVVEKRIFEGTSEVTS
jgi:hypothetical protein